MMGSLWLCVTALALLLLSPPTACNPLLNRIQTTKQLLKLYKQQLDLLLQLADEQNLTAQLASLSAGNISQSLGSGAGAGLAGIGGLGKLEQQVLFQVQLGEELGLLGDARVVGGFVVSGGKLVDLATREVRGQIPGDVVCVEPLQVTTWINNNTLRITKLGQTISHSNISMSIKNSPGKWHHSPKLPPIFLQPNQSTLLLSTSQSTRSLPLKHPLLHIASIHQYKLLFLTTHSYGYLNPHSLQVSDQYFFQVGAGAVAGCYYRQEAVLFVGFGNGTVGVFVVGRPVGWVGVGDRVGEIGGMEYLGRFLFVYGRDSPCFFVYEVVSTEYELKLRKTVCIPKQSIPEYNQHPFHSYQFFKHNNEYKLLHKSTLSSPKLYTIKLQQSELAQERAFPWKVILVVIAVIAAIYYRSRNRGAEAVDEDDGQRRRPVKKGRKEKIERTEESMPATAGQDYIREMSNEIKRIHKAKANPKTE